MKDDRCEGRTHYGCACDSCPDCTKLEARIERLEDENAALLDDHPNSLKTDRRVAAAKEDERKQIIEGLKFASEDLSGGYRDDERKVFQNGIKSAINIVQSRINGAKSPTVRCQACGDSYETSIYHRSDLWCANCDRLPTETRTAMSRMQTNMRALARKSNKT